MQANNITEIIEDYNDLTYRCILFDGTWGIGKTYAVEQAKNKDEFIRVSLIGLKSADDIYKEIIDAFSGWAGYTRYMAGFGKGALKLAENIDIAKPFAQLISVLAEESLTYKSILRKLLNSSGNKLIIILDDIERICDRSDISELFGVVEFLRGLDGIKIALIGHKEQMCSKSKEKFDDYAERFIDRVYNVDDFAGDIDWECKQLGIDPLFIEPFREKHKLLNLRTIIKANCFYKDIKINILAKSKILRKNYVKYNEVSKQYWDGLRLTAFAVVIESIDEIKLKEVEKNPPKDNDSDSLKAWYKTQRAIYSRVKKYIYDTNFESAFIDPVNEYYQTQLFDSKIFDDIYINLKEMESFSQAMYLNSITIKGKLPLLLENIKHSRNVNTICYLVQRYVYWCKLCNDSPDMGYEILHKKLSDIFNEYISINGVISEHIDNNKPDFLSKVQTLGWTFDESEIKNILDDERLKAQDLMIENMINQLLHNQYTDKEFKISYWLYKHRDYGAYRDIINTKYKDLICEKSFPIDVGKILYLTCENILRILKEKDGSQLLKFYQNSINKKEMDPVAKYRCRNAMLEAGYTVQELDSVSTDSVAPPETDIG